MLSIIRIVLTTIYCSVTCIFGCIYCVFSPRNPRHVATFSHIFGRLSLLFGIKVEIRIPNAAKYSGNSIYIANHQNNYDMVTLSNAMQTNSVTIGKKSLIWIPLFGLLYWLTGNWIIDRTNRTKAHHTITKIINECRTKTISFWMFPEGTRSRGRGLMPFKKGAFHTAIVAGVPIIPVCSSETNNKIKLNKLNNGLVIVEMLPPIDITQYDKEHINELAMHCHALMAAKINELNAEVTIRESESTC
ncbi:1-acyl-sn-glycerol-3-phosphate acyltransferase [Candidatus Profftia lariciata]|uniref:1-acylglycerol-3-phosphate O-acyltransferase n=1 Tax=Candidatus Profftia lariciata TaxID=1987921 RepID=UPI001D005B5A|nr:1-acylglycerol-3-phosphate O-acyltransferase [Candidatus Profftia lariciata]UDG81379.1 1-acyl-sn-glycerol-3-phosphate acyltransferase [Candidatus Profftia lariciata]